MALSEGTKIGPYEVIGLIGQGGMGEVWQARDTKLDRDVALKVLPEASTSDPDRLARFEREAKVLASLNHPNIGSIYGLEEAEGVKALVLELVEGPTLADRIKQGPIPLDEALPIAKQIAEALEAAHEQGVIHRDLKPANIKVREDGTVKVLDFGLAKAFQPDASGPSISASPTISLTAAATQMGMVIGTAAYMAPEQASGKVVDKRADVWAFGVVLYEMLTGTRPFVCDDVSKTLAHVIAIDPDWSTLPKNVPPVLGTFLRGCLQKNPKQRVQAIGDVRLAMEGAFETTLTAPAESMAAPALRLWQRPTVAAVVAAALTAVGIAGGLAVWNATRPAAPTSQTTRFPIVLPQGDVFGAGGRHVVALSPDGVHLAYVSNSQIYLRSMDQMEATPIRGTEVGNRNYGRSPFFSADGQWLGFWAEGQLKRVSVTGGAPVTLCAAENPWGASWSADDTILFGQADGIWRVLGTGGTPERIIDVGEGEQAQSPQMLPGGGWVLFSLRPSGASDWNQSQIVAESLETAERRVLIDGGRDARYVSTGHLVYALDGTLLAVPFNPDTMRVTPGPVSLVEGVADASLLTGAAHFALSDTGTLVYVPGVGRPDRFGLSGGSVRTLVWVDREGREEPLGDAWQPDQYFYPRFSPDGTRVAVAVSENVGNVGADTDLWVLDLARGSRSRITFGGNNRFFPVWSPDGSRLVFADGPGTPNLLLSAPADGSGQVETLLDREERQFPTSWVSEGNMMALYIDRAGETARDLAVLPMDGDGTPVPFLTTPFQERAGAFSPDGQWMAYVSDESGQDEVYVRPYPGPGQEHVISTNGGEEPVWSPDGRELFFRNQDEVLVVTVDTTESFRATPPERLFVGTYDLDNSGGGAGGIPNYDIAPNGQRFLMLRPEVESEQDTRQINVVLNWFEELKARVPIP